MKISIIANCQSHPIRQILNSNLRQDHTFLAIKPVYLIQKTDIDNTLANIKEADIIITQPIQDNYANLPIGTTQLRSYKKQTAKIIVIPNLYFEGYHPNFTYIKDQDNKTVSPRVSEYSNTFKTDYHDALLIASKLFGLSLNEFMDIYEKIPTTGTWMERHYLDSLMLLRSRELLCDLKISDIIESNFTKSQLFWTFNHPSNYLMTILVQRIISLLGADMKNDQPEYKEFLANEVFPILPQISNSLKLTFTPKTSKIAGMRYEDYAETCWAGYEKMPHLIEINRDLPKIKKCFSVLKTVIK